VLESHTAPALAPPVLAVGEMAALWGDGFEALANTAEALSIGNQ